MAGLAYTDQEYIYMSALGKTSIIKRVVRRCAPFIHLGHRPPQCGEKLPCLHIRPIDGRVRLLTQPWSRPWRHLLGTLVYAFFGLQSRFGDKPLKIYVACPLNGTAALKGLTLDCIRVSGGKLLGISVGYVSQFCKEGVLLQ